LHLSGTPGLILRAQTNSLPEQLVTNKFYASSGKWVTAANTNCLIWDSFPQQGELVTWSGRVVDGKANGHGVVQWFTNGIPTTRYEGEVKAGLANGHGIATSAGNIFEGDFKDGSPSSIALRIHYANGGWYKGENKGGFKEGEGEEMMPGGIRYVGHFKRDRFDGAGVMIWPSGDKITGDWRDSQLNGVGTYVQSNGVSFKVKMTPNGISRF
jgi:hypothetical protein